MAESLRVLTVGKTRRGPYLELEDEFLTRIKRLGGCARGHLPASRAQSATKRREEEGAALLARRPKRGTTVALDSTGKTLSSEELRRELARWRARGEVCFLVGGPDGLSDAARQSADHVFSLGRITLPHELALIVLLEQLYRALAAEQGHPYSRH